LEHPGGDPGFVARRMIDANILEADFRGWVQIDYVRRAMPFNAPGSLSADEIYAVSAYILAEAKIIDKGMVLDARTLPQVLMPNRDGFIPDPRPEIFK